MINTMIMDNVARHQRLTQWFNEYHPALFRSVFRMVGDPELAEDLVQDTFIRALKALEQQPLPTYPYAWLSRIATNLVIDHVRRRPWRWLPFKLHAPSPEHEVTTAHMVRQCLAHLAPAEAELLIMAHGTGLSTGEIAALLNENISTVRVRLHRARHRFRALYTQENES